jgi:hypothetical protein
MTTFYMQMVDIFDRYAEEVDAGPTALEDVATWAVQQGLFKPMPRSIVQMCKEALADSLRQQKRVDAQGRKYRAKHSVRIVEGGVQYNLWADIDRNPPRSFMEKSFAQRRKSIADDCFQAKMDIDHYNEAHPDQPAIQLVLRFEEDVAEMEAAGKIGHKDDKAA